VVLTAAATGEASRIDDVPVWDLFERPSFTIPFNVSGYPAISICSGYGESGLPGGDPAHRQAVPGAGVVPGRRRVRESDAVPQHPAGPRRLTHRFGQLTRSSGGTRIAGEF
jgi:hypothetical protein